MSEDVLGYTLAAKVLLEIDQILSHAELVVRVACEPDGPEKVFATSVGVEAVARELHVAERVAKLVLERLHSEGRVARCTADPDRYTLPEAP